MKINKKFRAFTLAEVMVLLLTLSILLAAFAPVFTRRYSNVTSDDVWTFVPGDDQANAYYDAPNKNYTAQAFIGLTPSTKADVAAFSSHDGKAYYSKLIVASSKDLKPSALGTTYPQRQMLFRYCHDGYDCKVISNLFANSSNMLLGGPFYGLSNDNMVGNTVLGINSSLVINKDASYNTAVGDAAFADFMKSGKYNTAIGASAGRYMTNSDGNTIAGAHAAGSVNDINTVAVKAATAAGNTSYVFSGKYNTLLGAFTGRRMSSGSYNTAVGAYSMFRDVASGDASYPHNAGPGSSTTAPAITGSYNTAVGYGTMQQLTTGVGNTAVGSIALRNVTSGSYNTALGFWTGDNITTGSYKTMIGAYSGTSSSHLGSLYSGDYERVFIGRIADGKKAAALEVHNLNTKTGGSLPIKNMGDSSVVVNGNLIVRGQTYLEIPILRHHTAGDPDRAPKGLVMYTSGRVDGFTSFFGFDGMQRWMPSKDFCNGCRDHAYSARRPNCICTSNSNNTMYDTWSGFNNAGGSSSYDWASKTLGVAGYPNYHNNILDCVDCDVAGHHTDYCQTAYIDKSNNNTIVLGRTPDLDTEDEMTKNTTDEPYAHIDLCYYDAAGTTFTRRDCLYAAGWPNNSCCPVLTNYGDPLTSDRRLKNVGEKFAAGLDEIKKLNIYNYTFKNDPNNIPQVGVIAQDLKLIFPNAVVKGENGYYQIRWDEMFYAAVNAIKTLNTKVVNIASRIAKTQKRIAVLKNDNAQLNAQLDVLSDELTKLEAKRK